MSELAFGNTTTESAGRHLCAEIAKAYREGDAAGRGFPIGEDRDTLERAAERAGYTEAFRPFYATDLVVCELAGQTIAIGDKDGPWAVDITDQVDHIIACGKRPSDNPALRAHGVDL